MDINMSESGSGASKSDVVSKGYRNFENLRLTENLLTYRNNDSSKCLNLTAPKHSKGPDKKVLFLDDKEQSTSFSHLSANKQTQTYASEDVMKKSQASIEADHDSFQDTLEGLKTNVIREFDQTQTLQREKNKLDGRYSQLQEESDKKDEKIKNLEEQLINAKVAVNEHKFCIQEEFRAPDIERLRGQLMSVQTDKEISESKFNQYRSGKEKEIQELKVCLENKTKENKELRNELLKANTEKETSESNFKKFKEGKEKEIQELKVFLESRKSENEELKDQLLGSKTENKSLEIKFGEIIQDNEKDIQELRDILNDLFENQQPKNQLLNANTEKETSKGNEKEYLEWNLGLQSKTSEELYSENYKREEYDFRADTSASGDTIRPNVDTVQGANGAESRSQESKFPLDNKELHDVQNKNLNNLSNNEHEVLKQIQNLQVQLDWFKTRLAYVECENLKLKMSHPKQQEKMMEESEKETNKPNWSLFSAITKIWRLGKSYAEKPRTIKEVHDDGSLDSGNSSFGDCGQKEDNKFGKLKGRLSLLEYYEKEGIVWQMYHVEVSNNKMYFYQVNERNGRCANACKTISIGDVEGVHPVKKKDFKKAGLQNMQDFPLMFHALVSEGDNQYYNQGTATNNQPSSSPAHLDTNSIKDVFFRVNSEDERENWIEQLSQLITRVRRTVSVEEMQEMLPGQSMYQSHHGPFFHSSFDNLPTSCFEGVMPGPYYRQNVPYQISPIYTDSASDLGFRTAPFTPNNVQRQTLP